MRFKPVYFAKKCKIDYLGGIFNGKKISLKLCAVVSGVPNCSAKIAFTSDFLHNKACAIANGASASQAASVSTITLIYL